MGDRTLYPALAAAYPVLFLWLRNLEEAPLRTPIVVLLACVAGTVAIQWTAQRLLGDRHAGAAAAATVALGALAYGHLYSQVSLFPWGRHRFLLTAAGLSFAGVVVLARRGRIFTAAFTRGANVVAAVLVALTIAAAVPRLATAKPREPGIESYVRAPASAKSGEPKPDVYHLVLDGYARRDVLAELYGYDNGPFLDDIERLGFAVGEEAAANYPTTLSSLSSTLNLEYLDGPVTRFRPLYEALRTSRVPRLFGAAGYATHFIAAHRYALSEPLGVDRVDTCGPLRVFLDAWMPTTLLRAAPQVFARLSLGRERERIGCQLRLLAETVEDPAPNYVFFHVISPHPPYLFRPDGSPHSLLETNLDDWLPRDAYVDQIRYLNRELLPILARMVGGTRPAIVLIQGDHGPASLVEPGWGLRTEFVRERMPILLAAYPEEAAARGATGTPLNAMRWTLRSALRLDLPNLEDRSYFTTRAAPPYDFVDVTDSLAPAAASR